MRLKDMTRSCVRMLVLIGLASLWGCVSTGSPANRELAASAAAVPIAAPEPAAEAPEPAPAVQAAETAADVEKLREGIRSDQPAVVREAAHEIIDRNAPAAERAEALRALAWLALDNGRIEEARLYADASSELDGSDYHTLMLTAKLAHRAARDDDAVRLLARASEARPDEAAPYAMKAAILLSYLDYDRALESAAKAHALDGEDCNAEIVYADSLYAAKEFARSAERYENADRRQCALSERALGHMAKIYEVHLQSAPDACALYERLTAIAPDNPYYKASRDYQCSAGKD